MIKIIRNLDEILSLEDDWNKLAEPFKIPTLRHEWFAACADAFCQPGQLRVIVVNSQKGITAIAPLVLIRYNGIEKLELLGMSLLFETGGFIYKDKESLKELVNAIIAMKKPLVLRRIRSESLEVSMLRQICQNRAIFRLRNDAGSPFLPIIKSWREFEAKMSSHNRTSLRRKHRQAERFGKVQFEIVSPDPDNLEPYLQEVFRVEASGWKGRSGTAILSKQYFQRFFTLYSQATARLGILRLCFLRIDGRAVAIRITVEYANRLWELKIGYDEKWAQCSPGLLLMHKTIRHAYEQGLEAYEFLGSDELWVHLWTVQVHSHVSSHIYPFTFGGMLNLGIDTSRFAVGRVHRRLKCL